VRLTLRHTFDFGAEAARLGSDLVRPGSWDALRETTGPFGLPRTRTEWEARAAAPELAGRARDIAAIAARLEARTICSHGVGTAALELRVLRAAPGVRLICTDFAPRTVERLRTLFPEADVRVHDLVREEPPEADVHLMHRIDTELTDAEWRDVFPRFRTGPILFVPVLLLTWTEAARELARRLRAPRATRAGYLRSEDALRALWAPSHADSSESVGDLAAFVLTPRGERPSPRARPPHRRDAGGAAG
jgi:hypothetical protein